MSVLPIWPGPTSPMATFCGPPGACTLRDSIAAACSPAAFKSVVFNACAAHRDHADPRMRQSKTHSHGTGSVRTQGACSQLACQLPGGVPVRGTKTVTSVVHEVRRSVPHSFGDGRQLSCIQSATKHTRSGAPVVQIRLCLQMHSSSKQTLQMTVFLALLSIGMLRHTRAQQSITDNGVTSKDRASLLQLRSGHGCLSPVLPLVRKLGSRHQQGVVVCALGPHVHLEAAHLPLLAHNGPDAHVCLLLWRDLHHKFLAAGIDH